MSFGLEIKRLRTDAGLSQAALAEKIGVRQSYIGNLESGKNNKSVSSSLLYALSDALGVTCDHWRPFLAEDGADARTGPSTDARTPEPEPPAKPGKKKK